MRKVVLFVSLAACGLAEEKFLAEYPTVACEKGNLCLEAQGLEPQDCADASLSTIEPDAACVYDAAVAADCLAALKAVDEGGCDGPFLPFPTVCQQVWDCSQADTDTEAAEG